MNLRKTLADCIREYRTAQRHVARFIGDKRKMSARNRETRGVAIHAFNMATRSLRGLNLTHA